MTGAFVPRTVVGMQLLELSDISRTDSPVFYRRHYQALAVVEHSGTTERVPVGFVIEHSPTTDAQIQARIEGQLNYPRVPVLRAVKSYVRDLERQGALP